MTLRTLAEMALGKADLLGHTEAAKQRAKEAKRLDYDPDVRKAAIAGKLR